MAERQQRTEQVRPESRSGATSVAPETSAGREPAEDGSASAAGGLKQDMEATARDLQHEAEERADRWTTSLGRQAESLARALRVARDSLWTEGEERMASMAEQAADQVDRMGGYLEDEDPAAMLDDLSELGRQNPGAFLGSAFTLGLAAGRFLRASSPERSDRPSASTMAGATAGTPEGRS